MKYSVYRLICPIDNKIKYIGATWNVKGRYAQHLQCQKGNKPKNDWIKYLKNEGKKPILDVICECDTPMEALKTERLIIDYNINNGVPILNSDFKSNKNKRLYLIEKDKPKEITLKILNKSDLIYEKPRKNRTSL